MYPFPQSITPAVRTHVDAQTAFSNEMSTSLFRSFQQICELNIQLAQTLLEETTLPSQHMLCVDRQSELLGAASARAQPASEKLRAYQQHVARLASDAQVELARVTEQHVQNTTRTARADGAIHARGDGAAQAMQQVGQKAAQQGAQQAAQVAQASLQAHQPGTTH